MRRAASSGGRPAATILVNGDSTGSIVNTTVTGSRSSFEDPSFGSDPTPATGLYVAPTGQVTIANSIIDDAVVGTISSNGANTFRDVAVDGATATDQLGVTADELFALTEEIGSSGVRAGVAADNGGPTPTVALANNLANPALDAADPADAPATDQRGLPRDATPDIGSFELEGTPPSSDLVVTTLADVVDVTDGLLSLREAIGEANARAEGDTITFAGALRGGTIVLTADLPTITDDLVIDGDPLDRGAGGS